MKLNQVAAQLYTLRDFLKTPDAIATTLQKVRAIGYEAVQLSGLGPIPEEDLVKLLADNGLTCCATHEPGDTIRKNPEKIVERLAKLNCKHTAYPYPGGVDFTDFGSVKSLAADLDKAGAVLAKAGQVLSYHNHAIEFVKVEGRTFLEHIFALTQPANLQGEIDTYWVQYGGADPVDWCARLRNRLPLLHMKDYKFTTANTPIYSEIGAGNLNWPAILREAEASGCEWFIVEQDTCPGDPFDSLQQSLDYIKANLCSA